MNDLVCFGEALFDCFESSETLGGAPFNVYMAARYEKLNARMITAVGHDKRAAAIVKKAKGIVQKNKYPTGSVTVKLERGEPHFTIKKNVAYDYIRYTADMKRLVISAQFFCFGTLVQRNSVSRQTLFKLLKQANTTIYDVNIRKGVPYKQAVKRTLPHTNIIKMNGHEKKLILNLLKLKKITDLFKTYPITHIIITKGSKGAELYTKDKVYKIQSRKVKVVDSVGAGDAFSAGIICGLKNKMPTQKLLQKALTLATRAVKTKGALRC